MASPTEELAKRIYDRIGKRLQLPNESSPPFKCLGLLGDYNGLDIHQHDDSIVISCQSCIERALRTHKWDTPSTIEGRHSAPLPVDAVHSMHKHAGPGEGTHDHAELTAKCGFGCRTPLGELLCACVTHRPDIGCSTVGLSKFSTCPHGHHFALLRNVTKCLRETKTWGITHRKPHRDPTLPPNPAPQLEHESSLPGFPSIDLDELGGFVDAAHANDLRNRRSTTGYAFVHAGGAVSYRSKTQSITATSSTEAEFLAAVTAAKQAKCLRAILKQLGFPPKGPTRLLMDNQSAINVINAKVPTERSRHIDIQHFAIQDWKDAGDIIMDFVPGTLNCSDDLTKPLGWVLHERHARRPAHYGPLPLDAPAPPQMNAGPPPLAGHPLF